MQTGLDWGETSWLFKNMYVYRRIKHIDFFANIFLYGGSSCRHTEDTRENI